MIPYDQEFGEPITTWNFVVIDEGHPFRRAIRDFQRAIACEGNSDPRFEFVMEGKSIPGLKRGNHRQSRALRIVVNHANLHCPSALVNPGLPGQCLQQPQ
jgi:hypothetical protein